MTRSALDLQREGPIVTLQLNRPDKHNIFTMGEVLEFLDLLDRLDADETLRVIGLTGTGEKSFSVGVDLGDVLTRDWNDNPLERLADCIERLNAITVYALNGSVYGGATDLALSCDFRIGVEGIRLVMPPAKLRLVLHETGLRRCVKRLAHPGCPPPVPGCRTDGCHSPFVR